MNDDRHIPHETLTAYLDGEIAPDARARVDAHLARCAECRATLASWEAVDRDLDAATPTLTDEDWNALAARVDRAIEEEERKAAPGLSPSAGSWRELARRLAPRPIAWSAAGAFAVALLVVLLLPHEERFTPVEPAPTSLEPSPSAPREKLKAAEEDAARRDAPSTGTLSSEIGEAKLEAETPAATAAPPTPSLQQDFAPQHTSGDDARARSTSIAALRDSLTALDARRLNAAKSLAPSSPEGFAVMKSRQSANESRREVAGAEAADREAPAPDPDFAREIELVAELVAADPLPFCEEARTRRGRWESDANFRVLSEESRAHLAAIDAACPNSSREVSR